MAEPSPHPHLERRFGLLQATALNMSNMIGIGPFITIPLLMSALNGPQALWGWLVALVIVAADGLVWSELGAMFPGSGGTYRYLRAGLGDAPFGRWLSFMFIWQFLLSGPLEIASGYIGFSNYAKYIWPDVSHSASLLVAVAVGILNVMLLYRRIASVGRLTVALWIGTLLTTLAVIVTGATHFDAARAFDVDPGTLRFSTGMLLGLGTATRIGIYDYLGYYDICYLGDEVRDPGRVIPRSVLLSVAAVALLYIAINLSVIGTVSWRSFVPASAHAEADFIVSIVMERAYGRPIALVFTVFVLWTAFASVFALLLGYSRIPYAAALDGTFFKAFARLHPQKRFPHVSLLVIGGVAIAACLISLDTLIDALVSTRVLVQFMAQTVLLVYLRRASPDLSRPFRMWLYPVPAVVALAGWVFVYLTSGRDVVLFGLGLLAVGTLLFAVWRRQMGRSREPL